MVCHGNNLFDLLLEEVLIDSNISRYQASSYVFVVCGSGCVIGD